MTAIQSGVQTIADPVNKYENGKWDSIILVTVGNEFVNTQKYTVSTMADALNWARGNLTNVHYTSPAGIVDTVPAVTDNPALCENSDYALVNCHAFFDPNKVAADAGTFVKRAGRKHTASLPNKKVIVMESGWPKQGNTNALSSSPPSMTAGRPIPPAPTMPSSIGASYRASYRASAVVCTKSPPIKSHTSNSFFHMRTGLVGILT